MATKQLESALAEFSPAPVVEWTDVLAAESPGRAATRARMRTMKSQHLISDGVQVAKRGEHGLQGAASYHSVLSVWASRLRSQGMNFDAERLGVAAERIENDFGLYLRAYLSHHSLAELDLADFFPRLVRDTAAALVDIRSHGGMDWLVAEVKAQHGGTWRLEGRTEAGEPKSVDVPTQMLERKKVGRGGWIIVINRMLGDATLTEVERAVPVPTADQVTEGPPYRDEEYAELAARYRHTGGSLPTAEESAELQRAHREGRLPRRSLRSAE